MKRGILFLIVLTLLLSTTQFVMAQKEWVKVSESKWQATFSDVFFVDTLNGWIVGSNSTILNTTDGGKTWQQQPRQPLPFKIEFKKVRFISPKMGWVVGDNGTVLKTLDGGQEWTKLSTGNRVALLGVSFVDKQHGWACGDGGFIMHTKDGGASWTPQPIDTNNTIEGIHFATPETGWAVGGGGTILYTIKGGHPEQNLPDPNEAVTDTAGNNRDDSEEVESGWDDQRSSTVNTLDALFMLDDKMGWAVGAGGAIVATVDGINWEAQQSNVPNSNGMPEPIWDVHFADENIGIAVAEFGVILRTADGGKTWKPLERSAIKDLIRDPPQEVGAIWGPLESRGVAARLQGVHMVSQNEAWIVGDASTILHSTDGGVTWEVVSFFPALQAAYFYNDKLGWAVGLAGSVLHTSDSGKTWKPQNSGDVFELFGVGFVNDKKGYIVGSNAALLETLDGGKTWKSVSDASDEGHGRAARIKFDDEMFDWKGAMACYAMSYVAPGHAWAVGEIGKVMRTNDGGETWVGVNIDPGFTGAGFNNLFGVHFLDEKVGWIVGTAGTIVSTIDGGESWSVTGGYVELQDIYAINPKTAWATGSQGAIMITTDGGETWIDQTVPTEENLNAILFVNEKEGWAVGDKGIILQTSDGGVTWLKYSSPTSNNLRDIIKTPNGTLWVVGDSTIILRY